MATTHPALFTFTNGVGMPITEAWIVRQVYPRAIAVDAAHRGLGVWSMPEGTMPGRAEVVVDTAWGGKPARKDTMTWTPRARS